MSRPHSILVVTTFLLVVTTRIECMGTSRVELHLHLDGAVDSALLLEVAQLRNLSLPGSGVPTNESQIDELVYSASNFDRFDIINDIMGGSPSAAFAVGRWIAQRQASLNVSYTEVRYDPRRMARSSYDNSSVPMIEVVEALTAGIREGCRTNPGVEVYQVLCAMRDEPASNCMEVAELAAAAQRRDVKGERLGGVVGLDLAGDESAYNNTVFVSCFRHAKRCLGLNTTVHAGELGTLQERQYDVKTAVLEMEVDRIGHGYAAAESPELMALLRARGVHLEACPGTALAELDLDAIEVFAQHNLSFGLNEDDPSPYFGGCDSGCIEAIAQDCQGDGLEVSKAASAACLARRVIGKGGLGMSETDMEAAYSSALEAGFA